LSDETAKLSQNLCKNSIINQAKAAYDSKKINIYRLLFSLKAFYNYPRQISIELILRAVFGV
jgi:hypothetical protein